jgi:hypothetical protein
MEKQTVSEIDPFCDSGMMQTLDQKNAEKKYNFTESVILMKEEFFFLKDSDGAKQFSSASKILIFTCLPVCKWSRQDPPFLGEVMKRIRALFSIYFRWTVKRDKKEIPSILKWTADINDKCNHHPSRICHRVQIKLIRIPLNRILSNEDLSTLLKFIDHGCPGILDEQLRQMLECFVDLKAESILVKFLSESERKNLFFLYQ